MNILSEGAEAKVYSTRFLGIDSILKRRLAKKYRIKEIDDSLRSSRTKNEARITALASELGIRCPFVLFVDGNDIILTRIIGKNLNDVAQKAGNTAIFSKLGEYAAEMHNNDIVHGDYTTANIMIGRDRDAYVIDFGLSEITNSVEEKALDLLLMKRSVSRAQFSTFVNAYSKKCRQHKEIIRRMNEIEKRGRYNTRTLLAN